MNKMKYCTYDILYQEKKNKNLNALVALRVFVATISPHTTREQQNEIYRMIRIVETNTTQRWYLDNNK